MKPALSLLLAAVLAVQGCSGDDAPAPPQVGTDACSVEGQKQFVLDTMRDVYFWNDLLPATVDLSLYPSAEALLEFLISVQPLDGFSYIDSAAADAQFFGEGQYEGYGFSTRFEAADDLRFTRVFAASPANAAGFERGQRILMLNGRTVADIQANEGVAALFSLPSLEFTIERTDQTQFTETVNAGLVTIDPIPQYRIIDRPDGTSVGYLELTTFISTAEPEFVTIFSEFNAAGVTDVIIDLRYNGGGLVVTTELLGDYLGGGVVPGTVFSRTLFNANNAGSNRTELFEAVASSLNVSRLVVVATERTASASELVTNSMIPHADVSIVGTDTFGKPVGQVGVLFCDKILRPTAFETVNSDDGGRYFDGLPADCAAADDLSIPVGDETDPNLVAALTLLDTGACPAVTSAPSPIGKPAVDRARPRPSGKPWRDLADAW
jgi:C-terminal processing protease CtpA/Prc